MLCAPPDHRTRLPFRHRGGYIYIAADPSTFQRRRSVIWNNGLNPIVASLPDDEAVRKAIRASAKGLLAWDPIQRKAVWQVDFPIGWNGGVLSTAGGLSFRATASAASSRTTERIERARCPARWSRLASHGEWSCPQAMRAPRSAMEVVVKKVLGYERDEKGGWAVLLEVEIGGTRPGTLSARFPYRG